MASQALVSHGSETIGGQTVAASTLEKMDGTVWHLNPGHLQLEFGLWVQLSFN